MLLIKLFRPLYRMRVLHHRHRAFWSLFIAYVIVRIKFFGHISVCRNILVISTHLIVVIEVELIMLELVLEVLILHHVLLDIFWPQMLSCSTWMMINIFRMLKVPRRVIPSVI